MNKDIVMNKKEKAEMAPPVVTVYGAVISRIPVYDPRKEDYAAFVKRVSQSSR
ncbi:hypothetical protein C7374_11470 [Falsochrobactrum ovis]|uniref:Uncharacterized protein n=1 Tax=Falsochrobactrum ovis TaxID=1293442 RepID=A0A364JSU8_9HYPH|nr:hypothetical protein C7374_11470 [Falsochrobactrum ovis]